MSGIRPYIFLLIIIAMVSSPDFALLGRIVPLGLFGGLTEAALSGVTNPAKTPTFNIKSFFSGTTQTTLEPWLAERMGRPRELYLRFKNGFDFFLGRSDVGISIGRYRFLNGESYVDEWCLRNDAEKTKAAVAPLIAAVISAQKAMQLLHKPFVFLISPSKAAVFPEYLPSWCVPAAHPRAYDLLLSALRSANVTVVDGHEIALQTKATEKWPPFGRDGAHWNDIGQFHAVRALVAELERQLGHQIGDIELSDVEVDDKPRGAEADAGLIANLPFTLRPPSPHASFKVLDQQRAPVGLFVGTSFLWGPLEIMMGQRLLSQVRFYYYFSSIYSYVAGDPVGHLDGPKAESDIINWISHAEFVVLEANEAELGAGHISKFAAAVETLPRPN
jgi:alginate O-acetyltransferase complex protein AlgJ